MCKCMRMVVFGQECSQVALVLVGVVALINTAQRKPVGVTDLLATLI